MVSRCLPSSKILLETARWLTLASSAVIVVGIAPSQILLGAALLTLLLSKEKLRLPAIKWTLGLFLAGTLLAVLLSGHPAAGFPQVKKIYVFFQLLVAYTLLRDTQIARWLVMAWAALGSISAFRGFVQFANKFYHALAEHKNFYSAYMGERITGFMSHWYTFSVVEMLVLIMLGSFIFFSPAARRFLWLWLVLAFFMAFGVLLAETRAVWIATVVAVLYLTWFWKKWVVVLVPVAIAAALLLGPHTFEERAESIVHPGRDDSNQFRTILDRTGVRMIEAHPWFGLGPEMPRIDFMKYLPADVPRPLPSGSYMHLHNLYLEYAAERGIPVLLVLLVMLGQILWDYGKTLRGLAAGRSDVRFLLHGGIAVVLAILVEGFADVNLGDSEVLTMFLVVVALGYMAVDVSKAENSAGANI
jgi:putative inorganic carbon (HCO3(-)) transporter